MMISKWFAGVLLLVPVAASGQAMNAEVFHQRATALRSKGVMAVFSRGEIKALTAEAQAASKRAADTHRAALAAGHSPRFCPPKGPFSMDDKQFMAGLSAIPASERARIDMTEAVTRIFVSKFPCR